MIQTYMLNSPSPSSCVSYHVVLKNRCWGYWCWRRCRWTGAWWSRHCQLVLCAAVMIAAFACLALAVEEMKDSILVECFIFLVQSKQKNWHETLRNKFCLLRKEVKCLLQHLKIPFVTTICNFAIHSRKRQFTNFPARNEASVFQLYTESPYLTINEAINRLKHINI